MKEDFQLKKEIKNSIKNECVLCGEEDCIRSHSISKRQYLNKISENGHVYGSFREKGIFNLSKISINNASTFFNFCQKCDNIFTELDNKDFEENNEKQIFLMYYRMLSAQVHQIKEEIIFFEKNATNPNIDLHIKQNQLALDKYSQKLKYLNDLFQNEQFNKVHSKVIKLDFTVPFVYFNIVNMLFDFENTNIPENNEIAINIFSQDNFTYVLFMWEKENDDGLLNYANQLNLLDLVDLQFYLTNIITAFPFNFYIKPSIYNSWANKHDFENRIQICAKQYFQFRYHLFNIFLREKKLNIFNIDKI